MGGAPASPPPVAKAAWAWHQAVVPPCGATLKMRLTTWADGSLWELGDATATERGLPTGLEGRSGTLRGPVGAVKWRLFPPEVLGGWLPGAVAAVARRSQTAAAALSLTATVHPRLVLLRPVQEGRGGGTGERRRDRIRARLLSRWLPPPPRPPPPPQRAAFAGTWPPTTHETDGLSVVRVPIPAGIGRH